MKKINKQLNLSINYTENLYKKMESMKMNMKVFVIFSLNIWIKQKMNLIKNINLKKIEFF